MVAIATATTTGTQTTRLMSSDDVKTLAPGTEAGDGVACAIAGSDRIICIAPASAAPPRARPEPQSGSAVRALTQAHARARTQVVRKSLLRAPDCCRPPGSIRRSERQRRLWAHRSGGQEYRQRFRQPFPASCRAQKTRGARRL